MFPVDLHNSLFDLGAWLWFNSKSATTEWVALFNQDMGSVGLVTWSSNRRPNLTYRVFLSIHQIPKSEVVSQWWVMFIMFLGDFTGWFYNDVLGGGFTHFLFSPLFSEDSQFD